MVVGHCRVLSSGRILGRCGLGVAGFSRILIGRFLSVRRAGGEGGRGAGDESSLKAPGIQVFHKGLSGPPERHFVFVAVPILLLVQDPYLEYKVLKKGTRT